MSLNQAIRLLNDGPKTNQPTNKQANKTKQKNTTCYVDKDNL